MVAVANGSFWDIERDSRKDEVVVFVFIVATAGLLLWAAVKPWMGRWVEVSLSFLVLVRVREGLLMWFGRARGRGEVIFLCLVREITEVGHMIWGRTWLVYLDKSVGVWIYGGDVITSIYGNSIADYTISRGQAEACAQLLPFYSTLLAINSTTHTIHHHQPSTNHACPSLIISHLPPFPLPPSPLPSFPSPSPSNPLRI